MEQTQIAELTAQLGGLSLGDRRFAVDLIATFNRYGGLSPKQAPWVGKLIARATQPAQPKPVIDLGSFSNVVGLFNRAKAHLKWPKITLDCQGTPLVLSVAGPSSKQPGSINVAGPGSFGDRAWYGRITPAGEWIPAQSVNPELLSSMQSLLTEFANDPAGVARKYGQLTGNCCFCHTALTDARSRAAGFGPVCADHYGLKPEWKASAVNARDDESVLRAVENLSQAPLF